MRTIGHLLTAAWKRPARRRQAVAATQIENLELRQLLSASGNGHAAAEVAHGKAAVPKIDVAGDDYTFSDGIGGMVITQDGLNIHGVITRQGSFPNGEFDASFKTDKAKVAKGTGSFILKDETEPTPVNFKIKFKVFSDGGISFHYNYKKIKNPA
jgi:hypothetical protein